MLQVELVVEGKVRYIGKVSKSVLRDDPPSQAQTLTQEDDMMDFEQNEDDASDLSVKKKSHKKSSKSKSIKKHSKKSKKAKV